MATVDRTNPPDVDNARFYNRLTLPLYDAVVLRAACSLVWGCPLTELRRLYWANVGARHLELGPGTGALLDDPILSRRIRSLTLLDASSVALTRVARRLADHAPTAAVASAFEPLPTPGPFDSAGVNFVFHCLPGAGFAHKAVVLDHIADVLTDDGCVFGATFVSDVPIPRRTRMAFGLGNRVGLFSNREDRLVDLEAALASRFGDVSVEAVGAAAVFVARCPVSRDRVDA
jgi:SAM-dependent methyltransferase